MNLAFSEQIRRFLRVRLPQETPRVQRGIYHYGREQGGSVTRFHLRVEEDGTGLLLANASIAARLLSSGVLIAKALLEGRSRQDVRQAVRESFRNVNDNQLDEDVQKLTGFIETPANPEDNYPIFNLDDPATATPRALFAPFHAQLRVAPPEKTNPLLQKLWNNGILHVTFLATGSSSVRDAVANIERAEDTGMISGLRGTATWLQTPDLLRSAAMAGADYVTVPVGSAEPEIHDGLMGAGDFLAAMKCFEDCQDLEVCSVAEVPLMRENVQDLDSLNQILRKAGVWNVTYWAVAGQDPSALSRTQIIEAAVQVEELAHRSKVRYVWLPPVSGNWKQTLEEGPRTAGDVSIRVEPDGSVYPARGEMTAGGNLLMENWQTIWNREIFRRYRQRIETPTRCDVCPGLEICAADCPGDPRGWAAGKE